MTKKSEAISQSPVRTKYSNAVPITPIIMKMVRKRFLAPEKSAMAPRMGLRMAATSREMEEV